MNQPCISAKEIDSLIGELADALQEMVETSCLEMAPLWLAGTRLARRDLPGEVSPTLGFEPSKHYTRLSRGTQNRYRQLACWRHSVLWQKTLDDIDPLFADAVRVIYFTPFPTSHPPYAWSKRVSDAPEANRFDSPTTLKNLSKEGCWDSVEGLRVRIHSLPEGSLFEEVVKGLLKTGCRNTLRDTLKLDEHFDTWTRL